MYIMGKVSKALEAFIRTIPDDKLSGFTDGEHTLYKDVNYRLDQQGVWLLDLLLLPSTVRLGGIISTDPRVADLTFSRS